MYTMTPANPDTLLQRSRNANGVPELELPNCPARGDRPPCRSGTRQEKGCGGAGSAIDHDQQEDRFSATGIDDGVGDVGPIAGRVSRFESIAVAA